MVSHHADPYIYPLAGVGPVGTSDVGGKAHALMELEAAPDVRVPPGFVVGTRAHQQWLAAEQSLGSRSPLENILRDVRQAVEEALTPFGQDTRFAVRSSGVLEDLAEASFAGQYDTLLNVTPDRVMEAIRHCWASASRPAVQAYADRQGLKIATNFMGVIVQTMVPAEVSGVSFSVHPVTGAATVVINAAFGLGEAVVSGLVTPDSFEIERQNGRMTSLLGDKEHFIPPGTDTLMPTPETMARRFCLSPEQVARVGALTCHLERLRGFPVDVEWAFAGDQLYCLQVRPVTMAAGRSGDHG